MIWNDFLSFCSSSAQPAVERLTWTRAAPVKAAPATALNRTKVSAGKYWGWTGPGLWPSHWLNTVVFPYWHLSLCLCVTPSHCSGAQWTSFAKQVSHQASCYSSHGSERQTQGQACRFKQTQSGVFILGIHCENIGNKGNELFFKNIVLALKWI